MSKILVIPLIDPVSVEYLYFSTIASRTFIERLCWIAKKAGYQNSVVLYAGDPVGLKGLLSNAPCVVSSSLESASLPSDSTFVFLRPDVFPSKDFFDSITEPDKKDTLYLAGEGDAAMTVKVSEINKLSKLLSNRDGSLSLPDYLGKTFPTEKLSIDALEYEKINEHDDIFRVEKNLYQSLVKETDSFLARKINRKISLTVTRQLVDRSVTPNQMSMVSIGIGLVGAFFLSFSNISLQVFGALLFLLHSILDGCDGELARLKYMESRFGGVLDFLGDNIVHAAVFAGIGFAWEKSTGSPVALWCSGFAVAGTFLSAGLVYAMTMTSKEAEGPLYTSISRKQKKDRWTRVADYLSRRDFIYLVVVLAFFGQLHWFLVLAAIGAPAFFIFTLWSNFR